MVTFWADLVNISTHMDRQVLTLLSDGAKNLHDGDGGDDAVLYTVILLIWTANMIPQLLVVAVMGISQSQFELFW